MDGRDKPGPDSEGQRRSVTAVLIDKAAAKINLTLRVLGRRPDGYHRLESLMAFADLCDTLSLQPGGATTLALSGPFASACAAGADNLVLKAFGALHARVGGLRGGGFSLDKNIPVAAGIGGGSADAAAALRLLARANSLESGDPRLADAALAVGADVPVCLQSRTRIVRGIGEELAPAIELPRVAALLVNPGVALATREVFAALAVKPQSQSRPPIVEVPRAPEALIDFLARHDNDLTAAAIACLPVVADVLAELRALPGARLVRMSGSGPTCFALFASTGEAAAAAARLSTARARWWVCPASIGP